MPASALTRLPALAALGLASLSLTACDALRAAPPRASDLPNKGLARLVGMQAATFAWETAPSCALETATGDTLPESSWQPLTMNQLGGQTLPITDVRIHKRDGNGVVQWVALALRDGPQSIRWVRNVPNDDDGVVAASWRCVVDPTDKDRLAPHLFAPKARLAVDSAACSHFTPVVGGPDDLSLVPYDVGDSALFASPELSAADARDGKTGAFLGVRLKATGAGNGALTVRATDFDRCFVAAADATVSPDDTLRLERWLAQEAPDASATPDVPVGALRAVTGLDLTRCGHDGDGPAEHYECVVPSLRVSSITGSALGGRPLEIVRDRTLDAVHAYGGKLVPATDVVTHEVEVHTRVMGGALGVELGKSLDASVLDPARQQTRASLGWRLLRPQDTTGVIDATDTLELDVTYATPAPDTLEARRARKWVVGKKSVPNPDFYRALRDYERVRAELEAVLRLGGGAAPDRRTVLKQRLADAKTKVDATPKVITVDDVQPFTWWGKVIRRKGTATVKAILRGADGSAELTTSLDVPFEAVDTEDTADPAHGLVTKAAKAPTAGDADRALATALVDRIDDVVGGWLLQQHLGAAVAPPVKPATRAWALAAARRASNDRTLALVSDWSESRLDVLSSSMFTVPVDLPADSGSRCFVVTALPLDPRGDANLVFGVAPAKGSKRFVAIGRDARPAHEAAFELCGVAPGQYAVGVWAGHDAETPGFLISIFESTPGNARDDDMRTAATGAPRAGAPGGEPPTLTIPARH